MKFCTYVIYNIFLCYFYADPVILHFSNSTVFFGAAVKMASEVLEVGEKNGKMFLHICVLVDDGLSLSNEHGVVQPSSCVRI